MKRSYTHWYACRVPISGTRRLKQYLEQEGIEHYSFPAGVHKLLSGLLFLRTDYESALGLPDKSGFRISYFSDVSTQRLLEIPDKEMEGFLFLQKFWDKIVVLPDPGKLTGGERVRIMQGDFMGLEGELYRIKGHKRVVVRMGSLLAFATSYVPKEHLEKL